MALADSTGALFKSHFAPYGFSDSCHVIQLSSTIVCFVLFLTKPSEHTAVWSEPIKRPGRPTPILTAFGLLGPFSSDKSSRQYFDILGNTPAYFCQVLYDMDTFSCLCASYESTPPCKTANCCFYTWRFVLIIQRSCSADSLVDLGHSPNYLFPSHFNFLC